MMSSLGNYDKLKEELNRIFVEGINLEDDIFLNLLLSDIKSPKGVLEIVRNLKGEGNSLFKQQEIGDALEKYGYAGVLLARGTFVTDDDKFAFLDLALCILLNITACLSKERDFEQVGQVCSVVLEFDPKNVKALFRRATAALELGKPHWAYWDLWTAVELQPRNQEVLKKFEEVKSTLNDEKSADNAQGFTPIGLGLGLPSPKSNVRESLSVGNGRNYNEKQGIDSTICMNNDQWETNLSFRSKEENQDLTSKNDMGSTNDMGSKDKEEVMEVREEKMNEGEIHCKSFQTSIQAEPMYRFDNRKRPGSSISISGKDYELLMKGKAIHCFNAKFGTPMTIYVKAPKDDFKRKDSSSRDAMDAVSHLDQGKEDAKRANKFDVTTKGMEVEGRSIAKDEWELLSISNKSTFSVFQFAAKRKHEDSFNSKTSDKLKVLKRKSSCPWPKKTSDLAITPFSSFWCFDFCRFQVGRKRKVQDSSDLVQCPRKRPFVNSCSSVSAFGSVSFNSISCSNELSALDLGCSVDGATQDMVFDH